MSYKIIDLPALGRPFNATDIIEVSANGTGSYKANIGNFTLGGTNYIFVNANGTPAQNGAAVKSAYTAAQAMTPNGSPPASFNRVVILLAPGYYTFNEAVDGPFTVNQSFIDFESLSGNPDVYFSSIQVDSTGGGINVFLSGIDTTKNFFYTHAAFAITTEAGGNENIVVTNCVGGDYSFSSFSQGFKGSYTNCFGGSYSFCSTGDGSTPAGITAFSVTGNFENFGSIKNCTASSFSFVSGIDSISAPAGTINNYGLIENCKGVSNSFCYSEFRVLNAGTIQNCEGRDFVFAATNDVINNGASVNTGSIINCTAVDSSICFYAGSSIANADAFNPAFISNCRVNDTGAFGIVINDGFITGLNSGQILNCYINGAGFCGENGQNSGLIIECIASDKSFCNNNSSWILNDILRCTLLADTFSVGATGGGRIVLGIDTTGVVNI